MSLIIDGLKKAQQLRLKESKETPFPTSSLPYSQKSLRSLRKRWSVIGVGLANLVIFSVIFWSLFPPTSTSIPIRTAVRIEKKAPVPIEEKKNQEASKNMTSLTKDKEPLPTLPAVGRRQAGAETLPYVEAALNGRLSPSVSKDALSLSKGPQIKKSLPKPNPSIKEKREEPPVKPVAVPPSSASLKEKAPAKSIEVKREGDKEPPFASEILTHFNLGVQFQNQREFSKAIQAYQKVIELEPTYVEAYNNLGIIYQEIGDFDRAFGAFQKSIEINLRYEKGHNNLGIILYLKGRNEEAIESFQKALAINSNNIESHINLGVLFKKQGQLNRAIESYQKALDINPLHREMHYNIALLYEQSDNVKLAIGHYQQFIQLASKTHPDLVSRVQRNMEYLMKTKGNRK